MSYIVKHALDRMDTSRRSSLLELNMAHTHTHKYYSTSTKNKVLVQ